MTWCRCWRCATRRRSRDPQRWRRRRRNPFGIGRFARLRHPGPARARPVRRDPAQRPDVRQLTHREQLRVRGRRIHQGHRRSRRAVPVHRARVRSPHLARCRRRTRRACRCSSSPARCPAPVWDCAGACCISSTTNSAARSTSPRAPPSSAAPQRSPACSPMRGRWLSRRPRARPGWRSRRTCSSSRPTCQPVTSVVAAVARAATARRTHRRGCGAARLRGAAGDPGRWRGSALRRRARGPCRPRRTGLAHRWSRPSAARARSRFDHPLSAASWIEDRYTTELWRTPTCCWPSAPRWAR